MRLDYLRYFDHLAEILNYTRAAEDLYIAQPTLSVAIKRMEKELGIKLFQRGEGATRIELTEMGKAYHEYVSLALKNLDTGLRIAREIQGEMNSSVKVGTIYAMQGRFWSEAIEEFMSSYSARPQISIEQAYSPALTSRLRKGDLDVAFASRVDDGDDLNHVLVWSQPLVLGVHKDSPLAKRKSVNLSDLGDKEVLTYSPSSPTDASIREHIPESVNLRREFADEITMCSLVSSSKEKMALFCYSFLVTAFQDVVCVRVNDLPMDFHKVYLISRRETHPKIVDDFIEFMGAYRFPSIMLGGGWPHKPFSFSPVMRCRKTGVRADMGCDFGGCVRLAA